VSDWKERSDVIWIIWQAWIVKILFYHCQIQSYIQE